MKGSLDLVTGPASLNYTYYRWPYVGPPQYGIVRAVCLLGTKYRGGGVCPLVSDRELRELQARTGSSLQYCMGLHHQRMMQPPVRYLKECAT